MFKKTPLIFEKDKNTDKYLDTPKPDVPELKLSDYLPSKMIRKALPEIPSLAEPEVVRHFSNLADKNHHVDKDFYPLGSCTMKYNPKINDKIASFPSFLNVHPDQDPSTFQGHLELLYNLEKMLNSITGMHSTTLQPSAGSQGEFVGLLIMQKYHQAKQNNKDTILIPETAHGTNPASVILAGYKVVQIKTDQDGCIDIDDLKLKTDNNVAGMMLTQPNTLGVFESRIQEIKKIISSVDGLLYMDGANLNALLNICRPGDLGFDIVHMNLHKTFSTPHGGGGPGSGPIGVVEKLRPYLPSPIIVKEKKCYSLVYSEDSIGKIHSFYGNAGVLIRAYCYIKSIGSIGLKEISMNAIVNANYLKAKLKNHYNVPFSEGTMHEFVISAVNQKNKGLKALDIAKLIIDKGYHAPTIYFPINVPEAIMIEPTETESKKTLDDFIELMIYIDENIDKKLDEFLKAPVKTPVSRLNETKANRELDLAWKKNEL